jgi:hypothetical protein
MSRPELNTLQNLLLDKTVLAQLTEPLHKILGDLRHHHSQFTTLTMPLFSVLGCLRHLMGTTTLRGQVQDLYHLVEADKVPLARSTWSDALNSPQRQDVLERVLPKLYSLAQTQLPDRLADIPGLGERSVYAVDGTYQQESCHFQRSTPKQGGTDNPKGHCLMPYFDVRLGIPIDVSVDVSSAHETTLLKAYALEKHSLLRDEGALWLADRGFVDATFWDSIKQARDVEVITRFKTNLVITERNARPIEPLLLNEGILSDEHVQLKSSAQLWRLISYKTSTGQTYTYLTNNFDLEPGVIAFLYLRRWDEEKCFDTWKNDLGQKKAWGKGVTAIRNQTLLAIITSILVALLMSEQQKQWGIGDEKSLAKQEKRFHDAITEKQQNDKEKETRPWYLLYYNNVSKVSRQVFRFFKSCLLKRASKRLYERQLKPLLLAYL